jgi:murein DD-endopeptidase MepM/ murein hydrolase activator NlpD
MNLPILGKPMKGNEGDMQEATVRRSRPFLTILEAESPQKARKPPEHRLPAASRRHVVRHPLSSIKKEERRVHSSISEGAEQVSKRSGHAISSIGKSLIGLPARAGSLLSATGKGLSGAARRLPGLRGRLTGFWERLIHVKIPPRKVLAFAVLGFAGLLTISVGANAIIAARKFPISSSDLLLPDEDSVQASLLSYLAPDDDADELPPGSLPPIPVAVKMSTYTVKNGESLDKVAKRFGLRQDTIISANNLQRASSVRPGVSLRIPNINGVSYKVRKGENLQSIAKSFGAEVTRIVDANDLASGNLVYGQSLFIPNAQLSSASLKDFYGERFIWPVRGIISSPFGYRENPFTNLRTFHSALDIAVNKGTKVKAASDGTVADTGYNSVFGNYIILKHASGFQSLYGHLSQVLVHDGSKIPQGSVIGLSGNTGQSTGPHLHFSIFKNGQAIDPRKYVK